MAALPNNLRRVIVRWLILFLSLGLANPAWAWAPLPRELWDINLAHGASPGGAVIVKEVANYNLGDNHFYLLIRIYSDAGKAAAQFLSFSRYVYSLKGRTV